ncbi:uncharacterized protein LOC115311576 [Ixodes scapularis]|uniref:uncharacterized protein LOC115311576 n=1 Tax=Ixodes scapularis TaxID=6945 RepID=UPI001AD7643B|nr:uncharacterized protein LOC115311576 [Ixodes scapularis]
MATTATDKGTVTLAEVDAELASMYDCCVADGLGDLEIRNAARAFMTEDHARNKLRWFSKLAIISGFGAFLCSRDVVTRKMCMYGRLALIAILPYWDWTQYHYASCLIENPLYKSRTLSVADCQVCEDLSRVPRADDLDRRSLLESYVENLVPVLVTETLRGWPVLEKSFTLSNITQGYLEDRALQDAAICNFRSNLRQWGFDSFLRRYSGLSGWFAHWENCDHVGQKHLRQFYRRPEFLPLAVELTRANWVIASSGFAGRRFKPLDFETGSTLVWLAQVKGHNYVRLLPEPVCAQQCQDLDLVLETRDILLLNTKLWKVEYLPGEDTDNLAFAAGGFIPF